MPKFVERDYLDPDKQTLHPDSLGLPSESLNSVTVPGASSSSSTQNVQIHKIPKNIIRCGDGYLEEFSTDEEEIIEKEKEIAAEKAWNTLPYSEVDNETYKRYNWSDFSIYHLYRNIRRFQWVGYSIGSFWSDLIGITAPRYGREIREAERLEREEKEKNDLYKQCYVGPNGELMEMEDGQGDGKNNGEKNMIDGGERLGNKNNYEEIAL